MRFLTFTPLVILTFGLKAQSTPLFGNDIPVTINGYTLDAMEPHLSPDGNALFFNSINNGTNTSLYYAGKVNDSTFNLVGLMPVVNETVTPYLNAVASLDTANNFYWVSLRGYPANMDNLHKVTFTSTTSINFARVHGNFNVYAAGYVIMDAAISRQGDQLYYCNAWFNSCAGGMPCSSRMGIAQKVNDSTFNVIPNSNTIMSMVNDTNYIVYAPELTKDGFELYFTRALVGGFQTEICVSVRSNTLSAFSTPTVFITSPGNAPEAPTLNATKDRLYYHKISSGKYKLFLKKRMISTGINESISDSDLNIFPNPNSGSFTINGKESEIILICDQLGREIKRIRLSDKNNFTETISGMPNGIYFLSGKDIRKKIVITE